MARRRAVPSGPIGEVGLRDMREERERKERKSEQHGRIRLLGQWHWRAWVFCFCVSYLLGQRNQTSNLGRTEEQAIRGFCKGFTRGFTVV